VKNCSIYRKTYYYYYTIVDTRLVFHVVKNRKCGEIQVGFGKGTWTRVAIFSLLAISETEIKSINQSINNEFQNDAIVLQEDCRLSRNWCHVKNWKLMTSGERRHMIVAVLMSEQFRLKRLSNLEQRRQWRYPWLKTVPDLRGSDGEGPITNCFVIQLWNLK